MLFRQINEITFNLTNWIRGKQTQAQLFDSPDLSVNGKWPYSPESLPWFDKPDTESYIKRLKTAEDDKQSLEQWVTEGYVVRQVIEPDLCDDLIHEMQHCIWGLRKHLPNIQIHGIQPRGETRERAISQPSLAAYSAQQRQWMYSNNIWRIHGLMHYSYPFSTVARNREIHRLSSLIFGEPAKPGFSLSFGNGSEQKLHQDIAQFHIYPKNYLIGVWIALEDVHPDSGPVESYPGTHRLGLWYKHAENYPQTNVRTLGIKNRDEYFNWLNEESVKTSEKKILIIKKGQALFWHACLAHGGSRRRNPSLTRHSYILHMVPKNRNVDKRLVVKGPFI